MIEQCQPGTVAAQGRGHGLTQGAVTPGYHQNLTRQIHIEIILDSRTSSG
jgi:hypothetical protein